MDDIILWKPVNIEEFKEFYEVSNKGDIKNTSTKKILKQHIRNGYKAVCLYNSKDLSQKTLNVHQIVAKTFLEYIDKQIVNHKNRIKHDNGLENLEYVTASQNMKHANLTKDLLK